MKWHECQDKLCIDSNDWIEIRHPTGNSAEMAEESTNDGKTKKMRKHNKQLHKQEKSDKYNKIILWEWKFSRERYVADRKLHENYTEYEWNWNSLTETVTVLIQISDASTKITNSGHNINQRHHHNRKRNVRRMESANLAACGRAKSAEMQQTAAGGTLDLPVANSSAQRRDHW